MALSFLARHGDSIWYPSERQARWTYEMGVMLEALRQAWVSSGDSEYYGYIRKIVDQFVRADGSIRTYEYDTFNLDNIPGGRQLLMLYRATGEERYRQAADRLRKQLENQPRTPSGGFWHKKIYPNQMWLDGLYMAEPFYAQHSGMVGDTAALNDLVKQFTLVEAHTRDEQTGLLYHAWDESRTQKWADPVTGCSPHFWGRAMGWMMMALVDVLDVFPSEHRGRQNLVEMLDRLAKSVRDARDPGSGLWYQVVDQPGREGNYLESSASCMFIYAMAKGAAQGYLDSSYTQVASSSFRSLCARMVTVDHEGLVSLHQTCQGAGLGGKPYRDGSFEYYIGEPKRTNDFKAVGPFIMAALQLERNAAGETGLRKEDEHVPWAEALLQPPPWYGSREAVRIADNLLAYQCPSGGWEKNIDMAEDSPGPPHSCIGTIDNGATYRQIRFLARVCTSTGIERFADSFHRGMEYLFKAQYENGGWPQFYPLRKGYSSHITFNDDAMANVLKLLQDIVDGRPEFGFVESGCRARASRAIQKGIECILRCQVRVGDTLTAWCAQHDEQTFLPAPARSFEPVSLSGRESVGIVELLMRQQSPDARTVRSIQAAVRWLNRAKIRGIRLERVPDPGAPKGINTLLLRDPGAPALWARFYEIGTNRPLFVDRDGVERDRLDQLSAERRNNYAWFGEWGESLLSTDYPRWQKQWVPGDNVLDDEGAVR